MKSTTTVAVMRCAGLRREVAAETIVEAVPIIGVDRDRRIGVHYLDGTVKRYFTAERIEFVER